MLDQSAHVSRADLKTRKDDLYETPPCAVHALAVVEPIIDPVWECACGPGAIVDVLRYHGNAVRATDLVNYDCPQSESGIDFLLETQCWSGTILTNPPYKLAAKFARKAIDLCPLVIMLMRLAFLEGTTRSDVLDKLSRVHVFSRRLPMMHREGWNGPVISTTMMPFAWFVWDRHHSGPTTLSRIDWK